MNIVFWGEEGRSGTTAHMLAVSVMLALRYPHIEPNAVSLHKEQANYRILDWYRILKSGYNNYFLPLRMLHYKGESTVKSSYRYVHTFYQAMQLFFNKHYSHYSLLLSLPITLAIWLRAMLAYVGNQFRHRREKSVSLCPLNCLVVGSEAIKDEIMGLLKRKYPKCRHAFVAGTEESLPMGHLSKDIDLTGYDTVVYDADAYSYSAMLGLISREERMRMRLGTYSAKTKVLITESAVHCNDNE